MRRQTNAAAGVAAQTERRATSRDDRGFSAAAAAGSFRQVVGIPCAPVKQVVGLECQAEFGNVGLSQHDRTGGSEQRHGGGITLGDMLRAAESSAGADQTSGFER